MNMNSFMARMGNLMPHEDQIPMSLLSGGAWNSCCPWGTVNGCQSADPCAAAAAESTDPCAAVDAAETTDSCAADGRRRRCRPYRNCCCCCCCCNHCHPPRPCPPVSDRVPFTLYKVDQNGASLGGAVFQLEQYQGSDTLTQTVDAAGSATFELLPDTYYILRETQAPAGYAPMTETPYIYVTSGGQVYVDGVLTQRPTFTNTPAVAPTTFSFSKYNSQSQPLSGAMFTLTGPSGSSVVAYSDSNGQVTFSNLTPGTYTMRETIPPNGYEPNTTVYQVVVSANGIITVNGGPASSFFVLNYRIPRPA